MKKRYDIHILGQQLSVLSDSGDEHVARVVQCVNDKIEEIGKSQNTFNALKIAILAALNIADEQMRTNRAERVFQELESRSEKLLNLINDTQRPSP